eukprot:331632-Alexandrium_andersonii.AAC.1
MSASLVGSEMCIRDRFTATRASPPAFRPIASQSEKVREALGRPDRGRVPRSTLYTPTVTRTPLDEEGCPLEDKATT